MEDRGNFINNLQRANFYSAARDVCCDYVLTNFSSLSSNGPFYTTLPYTVYT